MVALTKLRQLLDIDIDNISDHDELTANRKVVLGASRSVLETLVKVDENRLRKQSIDTMPQLLAEIHEFQMKRGTVTVEAK
jgi:hypothetical protein